MAVGQRNRSFKGWVFVLLCVYCVTQKGDEMSETTLTLRLDAELKAQFAKAAKQNDRTSAQLIRDYMRDYLEQQEKRADYEAWFRSEVQKGLDEAEAGQLIPHEEIEAEFAAKREATLRKMRDEAA